MIFFSLNKYKNNIIIMSDDKLRFIQGNIFDENGNIKDKVKEYSSNCLIFDASNGIYIGTNSENLNGVVEPISEGELYAMFANLAVSGAPIEEALIDDTEE